MPEAAETEPEILSGDRPIDSTSDDKLGFQDLAEGLAAALLSQNSVDGLVIGMEGRWGSGKSSLLNLTIRALRALPTARRPIIVEFRPWLVGDRDALLGSFFAELATKVEVLEVEAGHSTLAKKRKESELATRIRRYAATAEHVGRAVSVLPLLSPLGKALQALGLLGKNTEKRPSLIELKNDLEQALREIKTTIIVCIDDVDRLDPGEVVELLRLVRSVANFPNVTYLSTPPKPRAPILAPCPPPPRSPRRPRPRPPGRCFPATRPGPPSSSPSPTSSVTPPAA